jgi:hypothetical protein
MCVMAMEIVTREDLEQLRLQLLRDFKTILNEAVLSKDTAPEKQWLRSREVRQLLHISPNTLLQWRIAGKLPYTKMGGIHYYSTTAIHQLLEEGWVK